MVSFGNPKEEQDQVAVVAEVIKINERKLLININVDL
jgi:hypothetical protein